MTINSINREEFDSLNPARNPMVQMISTETAWFSGSDANIIGTVILDKVDNDWGNVVLAKHEDGSYRYIEGQVSLSSSEEAVQNLISVMSKIETSGQAPEKLFESEETKNEESNGSILVTDINLELKRYFKNNPKKLYDLSPRKFEELIASVMEDLGFEVELTQATRDGGTDIIAHIKNAVCDYLTLVECKRYAADNKVGVGIVRGVLGVHNIKRATKSIIVTTSFFSPDAKKEAQNFEHQLDLKDYDSIKDWLKDY